MPIEEIIGEAVKHTAHFIGDIATDLVTDATTHSASKFIYSRRVARYFHGIGRHVIALATLGRVRIPTSLRVIPKGVKPKPRRSDWVALWVGVGIWVAGMAILIWAVLR
ncbi:MAG: hypothetical protein AABY88_03440 [Pseudomonadota bacterium]